MEEQISISLRDVKGCAYGSLPFNRKICEYYCPVAGICKVTEEEWERIEKLLQNGHDAKNIFEMKS